MNKDTEKTRSFSIDWWIPNRLGDEVDQIHVRWTGMLFWISPNTELHFDLCLFRAISHLTSSSPWLCSNWNLAEGRLGNHFQTKTEQTEGGFGYQVDSTAGQRNTLISGFSAHAHGGLHCFIATIELFALCRLSFSFYTTSSVRQKLLCTAAGDEQQNEQTLRDQTDADLFHVHWLRYVSTLFVKMFQKSRI